MRWDDSANAGFTSGQPWTPLGPQSNATVAAQNGDPASLLSRYRTLIDLRRRYAALAGNRFEIVDTGNAALVAWVRISAAGERVLVVHNVGADTATATLPLSTTGASPLFADPGVALNAGAVSLPPSSSGIWQLTRSQDSRR